MSRTPGSSSGESTLKLHGVIVRVAYDGPSAIKSALEAVPDLILCDLGLPGGMLHTDYWNNP